MAEQLAGDVAGTWRGLHLAPQTDLPALSQQLPLLRHDDDACRLMDGRHGGEGRAVPDSEIAELLSLFDVRLRCHGNRPRSFVL